MLLEIKWDRDTLKWLQEIQSSALEDSAQVASLAALRVGVRKLYEITYDRAPEFEGDLKKNWVIGEVRAVNKWSTSGVVQSIKSEDAEESKNSDTAPFNVAWGRQDGIRGHQVAVVNPRTGRVRKKLVRFLAKNVDSRYSAAENAEGDYAQGMLAALNLARVINIKRHKPRFKWAFTGKIADTVLREVSEKFSNDFLMEWFHG